MFNDSGNKDNQIFSDEELEDVFIRITEYLFERINEDPKIAGMLTGCFDTGKCFYATAVAHYEGENEIRIETCFSDVTFNYVDEKSEFYLQEIISADGR